MNERLDERLRRAAQTCRELRKYTTENMFLEASATICKLRDDLQRANAENAKLRELVMDMFDEIEVGGFDPIVERHGKSTVYYEEDPSWRVGIRERVRELRIEVDE